jgi:hypothetical protein
VGTTNNALIIKYNSNLQVQWATRIDAPFIGLTTSASQSIITTDSLNNIYVSGRYTNASNVPLTINSYRELNTSVSPPTVEVSIFGQLSIPSGAAPNESVYLVKYNSNGIVQWATSILNTNRGSNTLTRPIIVDSQNNVYISGSYEGTGTFPNEIITINNYSSVNPGSPPTIDVSTYATLANSDTSDSFLIKYSQTPILQEIPLPVNNQSNPYLPPFDTYYAMKNPSANCRICPDQNQKHYVKECNTRFPNANNGVNAVFNPSNNVTTLDPVTKTFVTSTQYINGIQVLQPTEEGCILEQ